MNFVDQQDLNSEGAQETNCRLLQTDDRRTRIMRRAEGRENLRVKAPLARPAGQFDNEKSPLGLRKVGIGEKCVIVLEPPDDHGLPHAAVAIDGDRRHTRRTRVSQQAVHQIDDLLRLRIMDPRLRQNMANARFVAGVEQRRGLLGDMPWFIDHGVSLSVPTPKECASRRP